MTKVAESAGRPGKRSQTGPEDEVIDLEGRANGQNRQDEPVAAAGMPGAEGPANDDEFTVDDAIPGPEPGVVGFEEFAADDDDVIIDDAKTLYCSVGRPDNDAYIRTYPDRSWWRMLYVFEHNGADSKKSLYLVAKSLRKLEELEGKVKRKRMVPYITLDRRHRPLANRHRVPRTILGSRLPCGLARTPAPHGRWWCRGGRSARTSTREASGKHPDPVWPDLTFGQMIDLAFLPEQRITPRELQDPPSDAKDPGGERRARSCPATRLASSEVQPGVGGRYRVSPPAWLACLPGLLHRRGRAEVAGGDASFGPSTAHPSRSTPGRTTCSSRTTAAPSGCRS